MIEEIRGEVSYLYEKSLVALNNGFGLRVWTTPSVLDNLKIGDRVHLFTDLILRETEISLYGFEDVQSRDMFRMLIKVNGVGPKAALAILSAMSVNQICSAVNLKDHKLFSLVPGIGSKTSQKLLIYLQDVLEMPEGITDVSAFSSVNSDLMDALVGLGYSVVEAQSCIQQIPKDAPEDLESRLRIALQYFS